MYIFKLWLSTHVNRFHRHVITKHILLLLDIVLCLSWEVHIYFLKKETLITALLFFHLVTCTKMNKVGYVKKKFLTFQISLFLKPRQNFNKKKKTFSCISIHYPTMICIIWTRWYILTNSLTLWKNTHLLYLFQLLGHWKHVSHPRTVCYRQDNHLVIQLFTINRAILTYEK